MHVKRALVNLKTGKALAPDFMCKELVVGFGYGIFDHDVLLWIAAKFHQRLLHEAEANIDTANIEESSMHFLEARELLKPGKREIRNSRIIARYSFFEKWYLNRN